MNLLDSTPPPEDDYDCSSSQSSTVVVGQDQVKGKFSFTKISC